MSRFPARRGAVLLAVPLLGALLATSAAPGWVPYHVKWGDSLWSLASSHGTTVAAIQRANGLAGDTIYAGGVLSLPGAGALALTGSPGCTGPSVAIRRGDNATRIAERNGVSLAALARANGLTGGMKILAGQRLVIPTRAGSCGSGSGTANGVGRSDAATVRAMIRATALREGVDPSLALAIGSVESGFNQSALSSTGAVGVMQLMPKTAAWLGGMIGRPINSHSVTDNITGGVVYLRYLLDAADRRTAIAGYYQGLDSVRRIGMYTDTRQYVAKVLSRRPVYA